MGDAEDRQLATRDLFDRLELIESGLAIADNEALIQEIQSLGIMATAAGFHVLARQAADLICALETASITLSPDFLDRMRDNLEQAGADGASLASNSAATPVGAQRAA